LPTRLFHWGIVVLIFASWLTQEQGWMTLHVFCGYAMFAALLFRLAWGFVGSDTARFSQFLKSPVTGLRHLIQLRRQRQDAGLGHNAAGGWMVLLLLLLLCVQVGTGLCANDQVSVEGPLAERVGPAASDWFSHIHAVTFSVIEAAIVVHVLAIAIYRMLGYRLTVPMITGWKTLPPGAPAPRLASNAKAAMILAVAALAVWCFVSWAST
jgi:cytochrome b